MSFSSQLRAAVHLREDYEPHEHVDPDTLDLHGEYKRLNQKLFDGKLGSYPMRWNDRKNQLAFVGIIGVKNEPSTFKVKRIEFSKLFDITYQQFLNRLAHEMIHVKVAESGKLDYGGTHGLAFSREMDRINGLGAGVTITKSEDLPVGTKLRTGDNKYLVAILFKRGNHKTALFTTEKHWSIVRDGLAKFPKDWLAQYEISFMLTNHAGLQGVPFKKAAPTPRGRFVTAVIPIETWDEVAAHGRRLSLIATGQVS